MTIAIDARELARKHLRSHGLILQSLLLYLVEYRIILFSDVPILREHIPENAINISRNKQCNGGFDLFKYQLWIKHEIISRNIRILYQINHFALLPIKDVRQIVVVHDLYCLENIEKYSWKNKAIYWISLCATMINAHTIFTVSDFTRKRLEHFFWKCPKIKVNYNGLERCHIDISSIKSFINEPYILVLGRVCYWKGTLNFVRLYNDYLKDCGYKLIVAGQAENEKVKAKLSQYVRQNPDIIYTDYVDASTKEWLMQHCDLFIYASRYDGFGLPPLELALRKKKILMNDIPVLREVTRSKGNYIDFYHSDEDVATRIKNLLSSNSCEQIEEMYRVALTYTWKDNVQMLKSVIEKDE